MPSEATARREMLPRNQHQQSITDAAICIPQRGKPFAVNEHFPTPFMGLPFVCTIPNGWYSVYVHSQILAFVLPSASTSYSNTAAMPFNLANFSEFV